VLPFIVFDYLIREARPGGLGFDINCHDGEGGSEFFGLVDGRFVFRDKIRQRFRHKTRWPAHGEEYPNLSRSVQETVEEALMYLVNRLYDLTASDSLCFAGGVALNSVANERIIRESAFKNVYIMPCRG
jgi:carbamoyltransferase